MSNGNSVRLPDAPVEIRQSLCAAHDGPFFTDRQTKRRQCIEFACVCGRFSLVYLRGRKQRMTVAGLLQSSSQLADAARSPVARIDQRLLTERLRTRIKAFEVRALHVNFAADSAPAAVPTIFNRNGIWPTVRTLAVMTSSPVSPSPRVAA